MRNIKHAFTVTIIVFISSCTMPNISSEVTYKVEGKAPINRNEKPKVGIKLFQDNRSWIQDIEENPQGFFSSDKGTKYPANVRKYGITYNGREFMPINQIVQDVLIKELESTGFQVEAYSDNNAYDYVVDGTIEAFQVKIDNNDGFGRNKGRSVINIYVGVNDGDGTTVIERTQYLGVDSKTTMWVDTAADRLLNKVLKKLITQYLVDFEKSLDSHLTKSSN